MQSRKSSTNVSKAKAVAIKNNAKLFAYVSTTAFFALLAYLAF